jgi:DNA-binding response OmpR family regulator
MRALIVEDDPVSAKLIDAALKSEGIISEPAETGEEAINLAKHYDYDIIVLDIRLPDMEGFEVIRRLRCASVRTPTLMLSGINETDDKVRGLATGADDYLTKPFHKSELIARVHAIVRRSKGHSELVIQTGKEYSILELLSCVRARRSPRKCSSTTCTAASTSPSSRSLTFLSQSCVRKSPRQRAVSPISKPYGAEAMY